ncbi:MAG: bifunctional (p)ppGpp synthetase/guanosine-3',5'-bis(diphosphate) 3'-pyrophosphohydrolase [Eubacterium sp.]|nr:bifunctional (p)ppGpp synthetase/guanosine-3',5'-bis(diphosphate) 3'-pyrophosphohydrolase [Eubacterium sp.]
MAAGEEKLKIGVAGVDKGIRTMQDFTTPEQLYDELIRSVKRYHPSSDLTLIEKAYRIAYDAHKNQKRKSGEPYIIHPLCVGIILADLELDKESVASGLLHDVVEDTIMTREEIEQEFGPEVAVIVDGVTKLGQLSYSSDKLEEQAENLRKMFLAMAKDIRVIMVKLADRLHNMRTLQYMSPAKQLEKARETLEIYSPIAQRLGITKIKNELDDLSLKYLHPEAYYSLVSQIKEKKVVREAFVNGIVTDVKRKIEEAGIEAQVYGRAKHFFSIYKKMVNQNKTLDQIYDLFAVRIVVETVKDCYAALGVIHEMYTPIPGRFKDYIAMPKQNMYQSLHTTLIGPEGKPFEIQIRTFEMHRVAEYGIAAHWKYKEASDGKKVGPEQEEAKLNWLKQILEWQQDSSDNKEFMNLLKSDLNLFTDNVYCFSPAGDVKALPAGSCTIDFAYAVHSAVGNRMVGARINGKLVPIETVLHNGDRVEIVTSQNSRGPSRDWLKIVKSPQARNKISRWFRQESKEDNIQRGRDMLINYAKTKGRDIYQLLTPVYTDQVTQKYGFADWDTVLSAIGHGGLKEGAVLNRLMEVYEKDRQRHLTDQDILESTASAPQESAAEQNSKARKKGGIIVQGLDDVAVRFSKCCSPIPGDEIVGFITRGRGVTIHRTDCINIMTLPESERDRLIEAEWAEPASGVERLYMVEITIYADNRTGLLVDVSKVLSERKIDVASLSTHVDKNLQATINISFKVTGKRELETLVQKILQVNSVTEVKRARG